MPDASARLYARLNCIPINRKDPESLDDLIVCAIGASERYYVCWRTRDGAHRQGKIYLPNPRPSHQLLFFFISPSLHYCREDEYNLPPTLHAWLHPSDGSTRDFASLRVVFGFGEEFSASDRYGKVEYKEPRKTEKSGSKGRERRSSSIFSRSGSREKSTGRESKRITPSPPRLAEQTRAMEKMKADEKEKRVINRPRPLSKSFRRASKTANAKEHEWMRKEEMSPTSSKSKSPVTDASSSCACDCHDAVKKSRHKKQYSHASIQTDMKAIGSQVVESPKLPPSPPEQFVYRTPSPPDPVYRSMSPLAASPSYHTATTAAQEEEAQAIELEVPSPKDSMFLGHMLGFFSEPGYQLGDGLASRYGYGDGVGGNGVGYWDEEVEIYNQQ